MQTTHLINPCYNEKTDAQKHEKREKKRNEQIDLLVQHMLFIAASERYLTIQQCLYRCLSNDCALVVLEWTGQQQPMYRGDSC